MKLSPVIGLKATPIQQNECIAFGRKTPEKPSRKHSDSITKGLRSLKTPKHDVEAVDKMLRSLHRVLPRLDRLLARI